MLAAMFTFTAKHSPSMLIAYGFIASVLPVWLLLARATISRTFLKIGTIVGLAIGIFIAMPELKMPAVTQFVDGTGPIFTGTLFPVPLHHDRLRCRLRLPRADLVGHDAEDAGERNARPRHRLRRDADGKLRCRDGADRRRARCDPGVYFAMNSPPAVIGTTAEAAAATISSWGFPVTPEMLTHHGRSRWARAPSCRAPAARRRWPSAWREILSHVIGGQAVMAFWYHFAILFEALFILTTLDAGTRVGRFMLQDLPRPDDPPRSATRRRWTPRYASPRCRDRRAWGYFLYQGVVDPLGGINTLWPLFGIANQMLAAIALILCTVVLFRMKRERYAWITILPATWILICTLTAGWQKCFTRIRPSASCRTPPSSAKRSPPDKSWRRPSRLRTCIASSSTTT